MGIRKFRPGERVRNAVPGGYVLVAACVVVGYVPTKNGEAVRLVDINHIQHGTFKQLIAWNKSWCVPEQNVQSLAEVAS